MSGYFEVIKQLEKPQMNLKDKRSFKKTGMKVIFLISFA